MKLDCRRFVLWWDRSVICRIQTHTKAAMHTNFSNRRKRRSDNVHEAIRHQLIASATRAQIGAMCPRTTKALRSPPLKADICASKSPPLHPCGSSRQTDGREASTPCKASCGSRSRRFGSTAASSTSLHANKTPPPSRQRSCARAGPGSDVFSRNMSLLQGGHGGTPSFKSIRPFPSASVRVSPQKKSRPPNLFDNPRH